MNLLLATVSPLAIDMVALVFVLVFAISGLIKGFTKLFFKVFGTILSLLFAVLLCASVSNFLQDKFSLVSLFADKLEGILTKVFGDALMNTTLEQAVSNGLDDLGLGNLLLPIVESFAQDASIPTNTTLNQIICPTFAYYLVMIISIIALFIIFKILFFLLGALVKSLYALKLVAIMDRLLGFLLGALSGAIYLEIIILVLGVLPIGFIQQIYAQIPFTVFTAFIEEIGLYNVILDSISFADIFKYVKGIIKNNII